MLVVDSQFTDSKGKLEGKKTSLWSKISLSLANLMHKTSTASEEKSEIEEALGSYRWRVC